MSYQFAEGDVVGYIYAQPGNDTTYLVLTEVRDEDASAWDCTFDMSVESVRLERIWKASDRELDSRIRYLSSKPQRPKGSYTIRELAEAAKAHLRLWPHN